MTPNPNWLAYIALSLWPIVGLWLYRTQPFNRATLWTILGAQMLLPVGASIKIAGVPAFDKVVIPNLVVLLFCMFMTRRVPGLWGKHRLIQILILAYLFSPFITAELNRDPIVFPDRIFPAETHYDALSAIGFQFIYLIPFLIGRQFLSRSQDNEEILRVLTIAGILYSMPMLLEVRLSPQLHIWVYGYFPHEFSQQVRDDGFRPVVFMGHGLVVAFFTMTTVLAAAGLSRTRPGVLRLPLAPVTIGLSAMLILCKSMGALVYGALLVPLVRWATSRFQVRVAALLAVVALCYPMLRMADVVPTEFLLHAAGAVSDERRSSLATRFYQEKQLLERAQERFWFGWGRWSRSRVRDEGSGKDLSTTDGLWIITLGEFGYVGFLAQFGLLAMSVFRGAAALRFTRLLPDRLCLACLSLIVAVTMVDQIANASLNPWTWLITGALLGRAEQLRAARKQVVEMDSSLRESSLGWKPQC